MRKLQIWAGENPQILGRIQKQPETRLPRSAEPAARGQPGQPCTPRCAVQEKHMLSTQRPAEGSYARYQGHRSLAGPLTWEHCGSTAGWATIGMGRCRRAGGEGACTRCSVLCSMKPALCCHPGLFHMTCSTSLLEELSSPVPLTSGFGQWSITEVTCASSEQDLPGTSHVLPLLLPLP